MNTTFYLVNVHGDIVTKVAWNQNMENYIKHRFPGFGKYKIQSTSTIQVQYRKFANGQDNANPCIYFQLKMTLPVEKNS